jgi:hypothetical protein
MAGNGTRNGSPRRRHRDEAWEAAARTRTVRAAPRPAPAATPRRRPESAPREMSTAASRPSAAPAASAGRSQFAARFARAGNRAERVNAAPFLLIFQSERARDFFIVILCDRAVAHLDPVAGRAAPGAGGHTAPPTGIRAKRNVDSGQQAQCRPGGQCGSLAIRRALRARGKSHRKGERGKPMPALMGKADITQMTFLRSPAGECSTICRRSVRQNPRGIAFTDLV